MTAGSVDLVFMAYAYHEFSDPAATMAAVKRSLKPGGRVGRAQRTPRRATSPPRRPFTK